MNQNFFTGFEFIIVNSYRSADFNMVNQFTILLQSSENLMAVVEVIVISARLNLSGTNSIRMICLT